MRATALLVPTNNGLPREKAYRDLVTDTRHVDIALATEHRVWVVRADVAGSAAGLVSEGASGIVNPGGMVRQSAAPESVEDLVVADIETSW